MSSMADMILAPFFVGGAWLTQKQAAEALGIKVETLRKWRYAGQVRAMKLGHRTVRIARAEVDRLVREGMFRGRQA